VLLVDGTKPIQNDKAISLLGNVRSGISSLLKHCRELFNPFHLCDWARCVCVRVCKGCVAATTPRTVELGKITSGKFISFEFCLSTRCTTIPRLPPVVL